MPPTKKSKSSTAKLCSHEGGCTNKAIGKGGVCWKHGAKNNAKRCKHEDGCTNIAIKGGVCWRHGAKASAKLCSHEGCSKHVVRGGVCWTHGAKASAKICSHKGEEECKSVAVKDGVCWKHSAKDLAIEAYSASGDSADALCMPTDNDKKTIILGGMAGMMAASLDAVEDLAMTSGSESAGSHVEPLMAEAYTQYMAKGVHKSMKCNKNVLPLKALTLEAEKENNFRAAPSGGATTKRPLEAELPNVGSTNTEASESASKKKKTYSKRIPFSDRVAALKAYKAVNGHTNVKSCEDQSLSKFCSEVRYARKNPGRMKLLDKTRIAQLDAIEFSWNDLPASAKNSNHTDMARPRSDVQTRVDQDTQATATSNYDGSRPTLLDAQRLTTGDLAFLHFVSMMDQQS